MDISLVSLASHVFLFSLWRHNNIIALMASWNPWTFPEPQTWLSEHSHKCSLVSNKIFPASALDPSFYRQLQDQIVTRNKTISKTGCGYLCLWIFTKDVHIYEKTQASQQTNQNKLQAPFWNPELTNPAKDVYSTKQISFLCLISTFILCFFNA